MFGETFRGANLFTGQEIADSNRWELTVELIGTLVIGAFLIHSDKTVKCDDLAACRKALCIGCIYILQLNGGVLELCIGHL
ncbi:MAG: Uncharacterised protein [Cryomorphaceae bacterium]|nr:MAG: Uncharacterised protein [Cryomorphaceae bacterium]